MTGKIKTKEKNLSVAETAEICSKMRAFEQMQKGGDKL